MSDWVSDPTFKKSDDEWVSDPTFTTSEAKKDYDWSNAPRDLLQTNIDALPLYGATAGGAMGMGVASVPLAGMGAAAGESLKNGLNSLWHGENAKDVPKTPEEILNRTAESFNQGAVSEMGGQIVGKAIPAAFGGVKSASDSAGKYLRGEAKKLVVNSTGATGAQASKFADDAGAKLLDGNHVRFGDNAADIAKRLSGKLDETNAILDSSLKELEEKGVTASADNVVAVLEKKISELSKDASQAGAVRKLKSIIEDIVATGESNIPISLGEQTKRGFNKMAGNWMDPEVGAAGKTAYQAYRGEVESAAEAAAPELAAKFKEAKETYGLLAPIEEAASRRANTLNQSPFGGLLDVATVGGAGSAVGGPVGLATGMAAAAGRKVLAPRVTSSAAVTLNKLSKALQSSPQMADIAAKNPGAFQELVSRMGQRASQNIPAQAPILRAADAPDNSAEQPEQKTNDKEQIIKKTEGSKYSQVLQNAAAKGDQAFNAAHYILSQRDPEYRRKLGQTE